MFVLGGTLLLLLHVFWRCVCSLALYLFFGEGGVLLGSCWSWLLVSGLVWCFLIAGWFPGS